MKTLTTIFGRMDELASTMKPTTKPAAMTMAEVDAEFGNAELKFIRYYKYNFTFGAIVNGKTITAALGGNHDDIYRETVEADKPVPFGKCDDWRYVSVSVDGAEVFTWSDY